MKHYCIYECLPGKSKYVTWFFNFEDADLFKDSMNNFRTSDEIKKGLRFVVRCLDDNEFSLRSVYKPRYVVRSIIFKRYRKVKVFYSDGSKRVIPFGSLDDFCNHIGL